MVWLHQDVDTLGKLGELLLSAIDLSNFMVSQLPGCTYNLMEHAESRTIL